MLNALYHVLLDTHTNTVLAVGKNEAVMVFLRECTPDTHCSFSVNMPNYTKRKVFSSGDFFLTSEEPDSLPRWKWYGKKRVFLRLKPEVVNTNLVTRARLACAKNRVIEQIMREISYARLDITTGVALQETIYQDKRMQAKAFRDSGYNESQVMKYPYIFQYADFSGTSFRQAADDILLKSRLDDAILMKTEATRLEYFDKVKKAQTERDLQAILNDFQRINFINLKI